MSSRPVAALDACSPFARGYLLAALHVGSGLGEEVSARLPDLAEQSLQEGFEALRELPEVQRAALIEKWQKQGARRMEGALDLHWSWLVEPLEKEPPALALLALRELRPDLAKEAHQSLRPLFSGVSIKELAVERPSRELAAYLRRHLLSRFALVGERQGAGGDLAGVLLLGRRGLYLLVQETGMSEIARLPAEADRRDLLRRMRRFRSADRDETLRLIRKEARPAVAEESGEDEAEKESEEGEGAREELALQMMERALRVAEEGEDAVGLVGIGVLAVALSGSPSRCCLAVAQKMRRPLGARLIEWRDEWEARESPDRERIVSEMAERAGTVLSRFGAENLAGRVSE